MSPITYDTDEKLYEMAKGSISIGGLNMMWDFTQGMTKKDWLKSRKIEYQDEGSMFVLKNGKIIMPKLGLV